MAILAINKSQSFQPGSNLWIIGRQNGGPLVKKMDWYLNFQITNAHHKRREDFSSQLKMITNEHQIADFAPSQNDNDSLMIAAERGLPTQALVEVRDGTDIETWAKDVYEIWKKLSKPSLRIFLPTSFTIESFKGAWPGPKNEDIQVVVSA